MILKVSAFMSQIQLQHFTDLLDESNSENINSFMLSRRNNDILGIITDVNNIFNCVYSILRDILQPILNTENEAFIYRLCEIDAIIVSSQLLNPYIIEKQQLLKLTKTIERERVEIVGENLTTLYHSLQLYEDVKGYLFQLFLNISA